MRNIISYITLIVLIISPTISYSIELGTLYDGGMSRNNLPVFFTLEPAGENFKFTLISGDIETKKETKDDCYASGELYLDKTDDGQDALWYKDKLVVLFSDNGKTAIVKNSGFFTPTCQNALYKDFNNNTVIFKFIE